jgi:TonB family protein
MKFKLISFIAALSALALVTLSPHASADETSVKVDTQSCGAPAYHHDWESDEESGEVLLSFLVGEDGKVISVKMLESSGFPELDSASVRAIKRCTFKSSTTNDKNWESVRFYWVLK